jgi:hypothetical protein
LLLPAGFVVVSFAAQFALLSESTAELATPGVVALAAGSTFRLAAASNPAAVPPCSDILRLARLVQPVDARSLCGKSLDWVEALRA